MSPARKLKTDPAELAVLLRHYGKDPRHTAIRGLLLDAAKEIGDRIDPEGVDAAGAARFLGVSVSWIRKQVTARGIPFHQTKAGGSIWFDLNELRVWWDEIRHDPVRPWRRR